MSKKNILDLSEQDLREWLKDRGHKPLFARKILKALYQKGSFAPKSEKEFFPSLQEELVREFSLDFLEEDSVLRSSDGSEKILLRTKDDLFIESVIMPFEQRVTLCVSSQVGCAQGCSFCQTGRLGLKRNLSSGEILAQFLDASKRVFPRKLSNVVFMGMGEPLDNFSELIKACEILIDPSYFCLAKRKVTVSTAGLVPQIKKLGESLPVSLAVSLHNAIEKERSRLMPINRRYPLSELRKVLLEYPTSPKQYINIEYVMIKGVNDSIEHAQALCSFLQGMKAHVNLIPLNKHPGMRMEASQEFALRAFKQALLKEGVHALVRFSRGQDISGACGQLATKRKNELDLAPRFVRKSRALADSFTCKKATF